MSGMPRTLALTLSFLVVAIVAGAASHALEPAASPRSTSGKSLSLDEAIKELELIRPPRPKFADDFTIPTAGGQTFKLSAQRGKPVFINFWATWCPPCLEEMPALERLWRRHKDAGFVLVAISLDADPKKVPPFVSARRFSFPVALDPKMAVAEKYGVRALASSFVIDRQGLMAGAAPGPRSRADSAAHGPVQALLR